MRLLKSSDFNKVNINLWKQNQYLNSLLYIDKLALSEPKSHISLSKVGMAQQQVWKWWRLEAETLKLHCSQDAESAESGYLQSWDWADRSVFREGAHHFPPLYTGQVPWCIFLTLRNLSLEPIVAGCPEPVWSFTEVLFSLVL